MKLFCPYFFIIRTKLEFAITVVEKLARDKHSSLVQKLDIADQKGFITLVIADTINSFAEMEPLKPGGGGGLFYKTFCGRNLFPIVKI
jgi:hypothetical protein